jgi:hypothetical protein
VGDTISIQFSKKIYILVLLLQLIFPVFAGSNQSPDIVAGQGWGAVRLDASKRTIEKALGKFPEIDPVGDVYFVEYADQGIQLSFATKTNKVVAIFFYNKQLRKDHFSTFAGKTSKGIDWNSTEAEVIEAYGKPKEDYSGGYSVMWRRMVYDGIDFRFENNIMVRIGIPGK